MNATVDTFMAWRNDPCIVVGKHQNTNREINHELVEKSGIPVIRRITGGGTVYHDHGNINFSFIRLNRKENPVDFRFFTEPIILFLQSMGLDAEFEAKSNIVIHGMKISGNAAHVHRGRVLHHGTLLFDSDLELLNNILAANEMKYNDRSVRSIRKTVGNISTQIRANMSVEDFTESLFSFIINYYDDAFHDHLNPQEIEEIKQLAARKYNEAKWNTGYSPDYHLSHTWETDRNAFSISLATKEAIIESIRLEGPESCAALLREVELCLLGKLHEKNAVVNHLRKLTFANEKERDILNQILQHLF